MQSARSLLAISFLVVSSCSTEPIEVQASPPPGEGPTDAGPPAAGADPPSPDDPPAIPVVPPDPPSQRPEPESVVRRCGEPLTEPTKLSTHVTVPAFYFTPLGAYVIPGTFTSREVWASGAPSRFSAAQTAISVTEKDADPNALLGTLLVSVVPDRGSTPGSYTNAVRPDAMKLAFIASAAQMLTYADAWGQQEMAWSITDPVRTQETSSVGSDLFVRERALVDNGAKFYLRVITSKHIPAVDELLARTACSTGDLLACRTLVDDLSALSRSTYPAPPSDVTKLQAGTDPAWTSTQISAAEVAILRSP